MLKLARLAVLATAALAVSACATKGAWMGAAAEKVYDKEREAARMAAINNNDDYYEYHKDGVIYVISDKKDVRNFLQFNEIPKTVTLIGGGPNGERVVFSLTSNEAKAMESRVGFKGGAQNLFEGRVEGYQKGFYGEVLKDSRYYVFGSWAELKTFRQTGRFNTIGSGSSADGKSVVFTTDSAEVAQRFKDLHG